MLFDVFDNNNSIIDDEADSQYHGEKRQRVNGEAQHHERRECTDKGYWHSQEWNQRCTPALEEQEDNQYHQQQGFDEGFHYFLDGSVDVVRGVENLRHFEFRRQGRLGFFEHFTHTCYRLHGVGITGQVDTETNGRITVELGNNRTGFFPSFHTGYILQTNKFALIGTQHDIAEFLSRYQTSGNLTRVLLFLTIVYRHSANRTGRCLHVLFLDGRGHIGNGQLELGQLIRIEPNAHSVVRTENLHITDTGYTL